MSSILVAVADRLMILPYLKDAQDWARGEPGDRQPWAGRAIVALWLLSSALAVSGFKGFFPTVHWHIHEVNFAIHEFGHLVTIRGPVFICALAGSIVQIFLPMAIAYYFLLNRDYFAFCFSMAWSAQSMQHIGWYISDARSMLGDSTRSASFWSAVFQKTVTTDQTIHDWNYILDAMGLLRWDHAIGGTLTALAIFVAWTSAVVAIWLTGEMCTTTFRQSQSGE